MAIQLNERDELIFSLIDEHQVLLEKHISWFISNENKPVLIRDRLRKLFYLDYLLCERHAETLPWWTTPTKPLVYSLSPLTRNLLNLTEMQVDLNNNEIQRHHLEIANLRMLFIVEQKEGRIRNLLWKTNSQLSTEPIKLNATVSFDCNNTTYKIGVLNHPPLDHAQLSSCLEDVLKSGLAETICIISRDHIQQSDLQSIISKINSVNHHCAFAIHQELYKSGILKSKWENSQQNLSALFLNSVEEPQHTANIFNNTKIITA